MGRDYYDWLHRIEEDTIAFIEFHLGKHFGRDGKLYFQAREHSKAMAKFNRCYHAPRFFWDKARGELVYSATSYKSNPQIAEQIAVAFLNSPGHRRNLVKFNVIGVGLVLKDITAEVSQVYFTIRLK